MSNNMEKLMEMLPKDIDAAVITSEENRRYFTDFPSTDGTLVISRNGSVFIIDSRYIEAARRKIGGCEIVLQKSLKQQLPDVLKGLGCKSAAFEAERLTVRRADFFKDVLKDFSLIFDGCLDDSVGNLRQIKTKDEIEKIVKAQRIAEKAFLHILDFIHEGVTERDISLELDFFMLKNGAEATSFETIAVSGKNSSMPHGVPSDKKIEKGDFITMDYGAVCDGYHSDMTRTVAVGSVSDEQREVYETVLKAQKEAISKLKAGMKCSDADKISRDIIAEKGYGECFGHSLGHGVGIEIHELPVLSPHNENILQIGEAVTVEPGIYLPEKFGVRIEDMVIIEENGCKDLTLSDKELIVL